MAGDKTMDWGLLTVPETLLWLVLACILTWLSRHSLTNWRCHGFYRYFAFIATAAVVISNLPHWHDQLFSPHQLLSWLLLFTALGFLVSGLYLMKTRGGRREVDINRENFAFENTARLVDSGIFRYIRHPMYSALLLFTWGVWLKQVSWIGLALCVISTIALWLTARAEERENWHHFGARYSDYVQRTKRFIPFVF